MKINRLGEILALEAILGIVSRAVIVVPLVPEAELGLRTGVSTRNSNTFSRAE